MTFGVPSKVTLKLTPKVTFWHEKWLKSDFSGSKGYFWGYFEGYFAGDPKSHFLVTFELLWNFRGSRVLAGFEDLNTKSTPFFTHFFGASFFFCFFFFGPVHPLPQPIFFPKITCSGTSDLLFLVERRQPADWGRFWTRSPHRKKRRKILFFLLAREKRWVYNYIHILGGFKKALL